LRQLRRSNRRRGKILRFLRPASASWRRRAGTDETRMADSIISAGRKGGKGKEEGSIISNVGIGNLLGGKN